jgi:glycosyltransferase involved in cell wall biosynthesis
MPRLAIVTNRVPDYRVPVFTALLEWPGIQLTIYTSDPLNYSCEEARTRLRLVHARGLRVPWATRHRAAGAVQQEHLPISIGLLWQLSQARPEVIVSGDLGLRSLMCWAASLVCGARLVLWSEETLASARGRSALQRRLREFLVPRARAFLAWGRPAAGYLRSLGVIESRIYPCAQAVNNAFWSKMAATTDRASVRRTLGVSGRVFLLVGQLIERKGISQFLSAWARVPRSTRQGSRAIIVGTGHLSAPLRQLARELELDDVEFAGAKSPGELAGYYAAADALVLPSLEDVWALVVNEALWFGLPVLGSRQAGAAHDLIPRAGAGACFDPLDGEAFTALLAAWCQRLPERCTERSRATVAALDCAASTEAIVQLLRDCGFDEAALGGSTAASGAEQPWIAPPGQPAGDPDPLTRREAPQLSIVVPLYNKARTVERALASVRSQSVTDWELIVVDDGSTDGGARHATDLRDERVHVLRQANAGVSAARNAGIAAARASLVAFLDADDEWDPDTAATLLDLRRRHPEARIFATGYRLRSASGESRDVRVRGLPRDFVSGLLPNYFEVAARSEPPICSSAVAIEHGALRALGGFPVGVAAGEDLITWARIAARHPVAYAAASHATIWEPANADDRGGRRPIEPDIVGAALRTLTVSGCAGYLAHWHRMRAVHFLQLRESSQARRELRIALARKPHDLRLWALLGVATLPASASGAVYRAYKSRQRRRSGTR